MSSLTSKLKELSSGLDKLEAECLEKMEIKEPILGSDGLPVDQDVLDHVSALAKQLIERDMKELRSDYETMVRISDTYDVLGEIGKPAIKLFNFLLKTTEESTRNLIEMRHLYAYLSPNQEVRRKYTSRRAAILLEKARLLKSYIRYQDTITLKLNNKIAKLEAENASLREEYDTFQQDPDFQHPTSD